MKTVILTPIKIEFNEVGKHLSSLKNILHAGYNYGEGIFQGLHHHFEVIVKQTGSKNNEVALAAEKAIQHFNPDMIILVGIAGGVKDVTIGDVVVANKLYGYESGKETEEGFVYRPDSIYCSTDLVSLAQIIEQSDNWRSRSKFTQTNNVFIGPIASGDKVIGSTNSVVYKRLKAHLNDTLALEMEAIGFGKALLYHPLIKFINIRGISDLLDDKSRTDEEGGQEMAIVNAVAFIFEMLYQLNYSELNMPKEIIEMKKFANKLYKKVLPLIQHEAGQKIALPDDSYLPVILEKIKPVIREDYKEVITNYQDDFAHSDFRNSLKRALEKDGELAKELKMLLDQRKVTKKKNKTVVKKKKNIISGSTIKVDGNFYLGDKE